MKKNIIRKLFSNQIDSGKKQKREAFKEKLFGTSPTTTVQTWVIGTPENPMGVELGKQENQKRRREFEEYLKEGRYSFKYIAGSYGVKENSYIIYNCTIDDALKIFDDWEQKAFIFGEKTFSKNDNKCYLVMEYWARDYVGEEFNLLDMEDKISDRSDATDYFSSRHGFKFSIPFSIFNSAKLDFLEIYHYKNGTILQRQVEEYLNKRMVGSSGWQHRAIMYNSQRD